MMSTGILVMDGRVTCLKFKDVKVSELINL